MHHTDPRGHGTAPQDITEALDQSDPGDALQRLAVLAMEIIPAVTAASVTVVRDGTPTSPATTGRLAAVLDAAQYESSGPCVDAAVTGQLVSMPMSGDESRWPHFVRCAVDNGVSSSLSVPILASGGRVDGRPAAGLNLYSEQPDAFGADARRRGVALAALAATALAGSATTPAQVASTVRQVWHAGEVVSVAQRALVRALGLSPRDAFDVLLDRSQVGGRSLCVIAESVFHEQRRTFGRDRHA